MRSLRARLADSGAAFAAVARNRNLLWLELAWTGSIIGHYAYLVAVSVYAYGVGGEEAVGLIFLARLIPAALAAPFAGLLGDRYRRERVLLLTNLARIILVGSAAAGVFLDAPPVVIYVLAVAATIVTTPFRSAQAALTPTLARSPTELTAANAVASGVDSLALFIGPAIAGLLLAVASTGLVFTLTAALLALSVICILLIRVGPTERPKGEVEASTIMSEALAGFRAIGSHPSLRVMIGLIAAQTAVAGAVQVYIVVASVELFGFGTEGVGFLNSSIGVGAFIGAVAALSLTGARRLSPAFMAGIALWGLPLIALGFWPEALAALILFGVIGIGNSISSVAGLTLVQRAVPDEVLARVFGVIQMLLLASMGIGAALAPALIGFLDVDGALLVTGAFLPLLVILTWVQVSRIDAGAAAPEAHELRILGSVPIFAPLPGMTLEHLSGRLVPLRLEAGAEIVREGDPGDRFYIVAEGTVEVSEYGRPIAELGPGGYFGEIALIRDVARTATVTTKTAAVLYALDRDDFLAAVTSHAPSAEAAEEVVSSRLAGIPVGGARQPVA
ncbi:MAG: MFS transporter [Actinobacteria bacterium]|nr:MFS transporter [Actinomycetota bacterium]